MSDFVYLRIPKKYESSFSNLSNDNFKLITQIIDWLGDSSTKDFHYSILNNLVRSFPPASDTSIELTDILKPYAYIDGYVLNRKFVQNHIIARFDFIYSPTSLVTFLSQLGCLNYSGRPINYFSCNAWKMNYFDRKLKLSLLRSRGHNYVSQKKEEYDILMQSFLDNPENVEKLKSELSRYCSIK